MILEFAIEHLYRDPVFLHTFSTFWWAVLMIMYDRKLDYELHVFGFIFSGMILGCILREMAPVQTKWSQIGPIFSHPKIILLSEAVQLTTTVIVKSIKKSTHILWYKCLLQIYHSLSPNLLTVVWNVQKAMYINRVHSIKLEILWPLVNAMLYNYENTVMY